jgi:RNA recognition motif. (a.k.a. RRM, RBD, or RNP domain)
MRLYVGNLSFNTDESTMEQLFASVGQVASVHLVRNRETGQFWGSASWKWRTPIRAVRRAMPSTSESSTVAV